MMCSIVKPNLQSRFAKPFGWSDDWTWMYHRFHRLSSIHKHTIIYIQSWRAMHWMPNRTDISSSAPCIDLKAGFAVCAGCPTIVPGPGSGVSLLHLGELLLSVRDTKNRKTNDWGLTLTPSSLFQPKVEFSWIFPELIDHSPNSGPARRSQETQMTSTVSRSKGGTRRNQVFQCFSMHQFC